MKKLGISTLICVFISLLFIFGVLWWTDFVEDSRIVAGRPASAFSFGLPFGGPISEVSFTECCGAALVTVDNANPQFEGDQELVWYYNGLYENYNVVTTNNNLVGDAIPYVGLCLPIDEECESVDFKDGIITIVGTE